jgi:hypothetical protein
VWFFLEVYSILLNAFVVCWCLFINFYMGVRGVASTFAPSANTYEELLSKGNAILSASFVT